MVGREADWVATRKNVEGQGKQVETKDTVSHSVTLSVELLKEETKRDEATTITSTRGLGTERGARRTQIGKSGRQCDGGKLDEWSISLCRQAQPQDERCPEEIVRMVVKLVFFHIASERGDFVKHAHRNHNRNADTFAHEGAAGREGGLGKQEEVRLEQKEINQTVLGWECKAVGV